MQRRRFALGLLHTALFSTARIGSAEPQPHVVFLNPGEPVERGTGPYWRVVTQFMQPAARSRGVHPRLTTWSSSMRSSLLSGC